MFEPGARPRAICTAFGSDDGKADERAYFGATQRLADLVARCGKVAPLAFPAQIRPARPISRRPIWTTTPMRPWSRG